MSSGESASEPEHPYPWYGLVTDGTLEQGDLLSSFPLLVLEPPYEAIDTGEFDVRIRTFTVIVLTQSCDLGVGKINSALVCPCFDLQDLAAHFPQLDNKGGRQKILRGEVPSLCLLPPCEIAQFESPPRVANFRQIATVPFEFLAFQAAKASPRVRLLPPYREHLAQSFARFMTRVGWPQDFRL